MAAVRGLAGHAGAEANRSAGCLQKLSGSPLNSLLADAPPDRWVNCQEMAAAAKSACAPSPAEAVLGDSFGIRPAAAQRDWARCACSHCV